MLRDGTRHQIDRGKVIWIRDSNGNKLTFDYAPHSTQPTTRLGNLIKVTDSLARTVALEYAVQDLEPYGLCDRISYKGFDGTQRVVRISKRPLSSVLRADFPTLREVYDLFPQAAFGSADEYDPLVFSEVWLPDGKSYKFRYNEFTEVARLELPTGGAIEYDIKGGFINSPESGYFKDEVYRRLVERRVYVDGDAVPESKTTYSKPDTATGFTLTSVNYVDVDHWNPGSGERIVRVRHFYFGNAMQALTLQINGANWEQTRYPAWKDGREFQTDTLAADGLTVLRSTKYEWHQPAPAGWWMGSHPKPNGHQWYWLNPQVISWTGSEETSPATNPRIAEISVTLVDTNQVSKQTFLYDQLNNKTDIFEYDFGSPTPGALMRHTHTDYANSTNLINNLDYTTPDSTTGIRLLGLPTKQQVFDGNEILRAQTNYEYDNYDQAGSDNFHDPLVPRSDIAGFDSAFGTSYYKRGNITKTTSHLLDASGNSISSISSHMQYDIAGNGVRVIDPRSTAGNIIATTFDFSDKFGSPDTEARANTVPSELMPPGVPIQNAYAFPTQVTNALGHISYTQYNYYLGTPVNNEDPNGVVSSTEYGNSGSDLLDRPSKIVRAINKSIKNQTTIAYPDANHVITTSDLNSYEDNLLKSETIYDGLGRTSETRQYETSATYITTKQEYDALGRTVRSYNPHRTTTDSTYGRTDITYDESSRVKKVETFDQSGAATGTVTTDYIGNKVLAKDQAEKRRLSQTNALGQLADVWEIVPVDTSTVTVSFGEQSLTGYLTHYGYDALGDLTNVTQQIGLSGTTQTRTFVYDSLKRLTDATNPESGHVSYDYHANGSLWHKTDARGIVTTLAYDDLNRVTSRTYTDGTSNITYAYDIATPTVANSKGRLMSVSSNVSSYSYGEYDELGRVKSGTQTTDENSYLLAYEYDLAGNMKTQTYPSGRVVATEVDNAGRMVGIQNDGSGLYYAGGSSVSDDPSYANRFQYTAHGAMSQVRLGNGLWEHTTFNSRLQSTEIALGTSTTDTSKLKLEYKYGVVISGVLDMTKNNGNVESQTITVPGLALAQSYVYDGLNRLDSAKEVRQGTPCLTNSIGTTDCWKQTFSYDRYGNRRFNGAGTTFPVITAENQHSTNPTISDTSNRISPSGYRYDAAGNLECDPMHPCGSTAPFPPYYTYDAENRLKTAASIGGAAYSYDGDGRRVKKAFGTETTVFVYNLMGQLVAEYMNSAPSDAGGTSYLTADNLGTPRVITKQDGSVKSRHDYRPFGEELFEAQGLRTIEQGYTGDTIRQKFTAKERDNETGVDYFGARYYSSTQGRFTTVDPSRLSILLENPQSWNRYTYGLNNPLAYVDKNGKWPTWIHELIIDQAFQGLSGAERQMIKNGSYSVDDPLRGGQFASRSNEHGMTIPGQSQDQAAENADTFINNNVDKAKDYDERNNFKMSLCYFGKAFHTVSDMTSPAHEGYQVWYASDWRSHRKQESSISNFRMGLAVGATLSLYRYTYGQAKLQRAMGGYTPGAADDPSVFGDSSSIFLAGLRSRCRGGSSLRIQTWTPRGSGF